MKLEINVQMPTDEDGNNLGDYIAQEAGKMLFREVEKDARAACTKAVHGQIEAKVGEIISDLLKGPVPQTNQWGEIVKGEQVTLRQIIADRATKWLSEAVDAKSGREPSYNQPQLPRLQWLGRQMCAEAIAETVATVKAALQEQVREAVKTQAGAIMETALASK